MGREVTDPPVDDQTVHRDPTLAQHQPRVDVSAHANQLAPDEALEGCGVGGDVAGGVETRGWARRRPARCSKTLRLLGGLGDPLLLRRALEQGLTGAHPGRDPVRLALLLGGAKRGGADEERDRQASP